jgi:hypothetical protein
MAVYRFLTTWLFDVPREPVWDAIYDAARWPEWWHGVRRTEIVDAGDAKGEGALWRSAWRSVLPYELEFEFAGIHVGVARLDDARLDECGRALVRPVFAWNHHRIMRWGGEGAARRLGCRLLPSG